MTSETSPNMPAWFDPAQHSVTVAGIVRTADRALLGDDGLPASGALRAAEARTAKRAAPAPIPETDAETEPAPAPAKAKNQKTEA